MDILDIDPISFSARVSQVAAAELYGLLTTGDPVAINNWFVDEELKEEDLAHSVEAMATYALKTGCGGEQLYRSRGGRDWPLQPAPRRMAFHLFAATMTGVGQRLLETQRAEEAALMLKKRANKPAPVKREDTIFETVGSLGDLRPEAVEAERLASEAAKRRAAQEAEDRAKFNGADPSKFDHDGDGRPGGSLPRSAPETDPLGVGAPDPDSDQTARDQADAEPPATESSEPDEATDETAAAADPQTEPQPEDPDEGEPSAPAPETNKDGSLSVGEAPARPPVNRGGRGRTKPA